MTEKTTIEFKYKPSYIFLTTGIIWLLLAISRAISPIPGYSNYLIILTFVTAFLFFWTHYNQLKFPYLRLNEEYIRIRLNKVGWIRQILWTDVLEVYGDEKRVYLKHKKNDKIKTSFIYPNSLSKMDAERLLPLIQSFRSEEIDVNKV